MFVVTVRSEGIKITKYDRSSVNRETERASYRNLDENERKVSTIFNNVNSNLPETKQMKSNSELSVFLQRFSNQG